MIAIAPPSPSADERARKSTSIVLQRLSPDGTQRKLAEVLGVSESTVSRWKEDVEPVMKLASHLGLKLVDEHRECIPRAEAAMLRRIYAVVSAQAPWLLQESDA